MRRTIPWIAGVLASLVPWATLPLSFKLANGDPEGSIWLATYFGAFSFVITAPLAAVAVLTPDRYTAPSPIPRSLLYFGLICLPTLAFQTVATAASIVSLFEPRHPYKSHDPMIFLAFGAFGTYALIYVILDYLARRGRSAFTFGTLITILILTCSVYLRFIQTGWIRTP
jgi:hypothetical protein